MTWFVKVVRSGKRYEDGSLPPEVWREGEVCPTLNAFDVGETRVTVVAIDRIAVSDSKLTVRRLTPRECERLQGFPDDWTAGQADSHRYKQMGNAVTVNVAHYVGALVLAASSPSPRRTT